MIAFKRVSAKNASVSDFSFLEVKKEEAC